MGSYQRGAKFENEIKRSLQQEGYFVLRSAGSRSKVDLCAVKINEFKGNETQVLFVQCKKSFSIGKEEFYELKSISLKHGAMPIVAGRIKHFYFVAVPDLSYKSFLKNLSEFRKETSSKKKESG